MSDSENQSIHPKQIAFRHTNAIDELLKMVSERLWRDSTIENQFELTALVDGARSAAKELQDLIESTHFSLADNE